VFRELDELQPTEVIEGCARGPDTFAESWAKSNGVPCRRFPALWGVYGRSAGHLRNQQMIATKPDLVLAFNLGTPGTDDTVRQAHEAGITVKEIHANTLGLEQGPVGPGASDPR
jgi:hypothetical protein